MRAEPPVTHGVSLDIFFFSITSATNHSVNKLTC